MRTVTARNLAVAAFPAMLFLSGCASRPLPDGSRIERLPEAATSQAPALTPEQAQKLADLNRQVLEDQDAARRRERRDEHLRHGLQDPPWLLYDGGWPYMHPHGGWVWSGSRWMYRRAPGWGWQFGLGLGW